MSIVIALADSNDQHSRSVYEALKPLYGVACFDTPANAIAGMLIDRPSVILIGARVGALSAPAFAQALKREVFLANIPIIFILEAEDGQSSEQLRQLGLNNFLIKPYPRSALLSILSRTLGGQGQALLHDLPAPQRKALEAILSSFNALAEDIAKGAPLPMQEINLACSALVEVVSRNELDVLLDRMKHDDLIHLHSLRNAGLMAMFAQAIGLPYEQQVTVASGGLLHDIGMLTIPRKILHKPDKLTGAEMSLIRGHVNEGERILAMSGVAARGIAAIVSHHHERLDGSGYPRGLGASQLNELARMAAIIDVFTALTERRPYKSKVAPHVAFEIIATEMRGKLDIDMAARFREILLDSAVQQASPQRVETIGH